MISLPQVTLMAVDTVNYGKTINSMINSLEQIEPGDAVWFTDIFINQPFRIQEIKHLYSKEEYSQFVIKELGKYEFKTSHILITQHDGYVLDGEQWEEEWLQWDYLGAPWLYVDGRNVGNGGFSLRSVKLHKILAEDPFIKGYNPEDDAICRLYRPYLEDKYNIKFAPEEVAHRFAFELHEPKQPTFGFHGNFHTKYQETVVIRRSGAMGDVLALEPLLAHFHKNGYKVVLDSPFFSLFSRHDFPIHDYSRFDHKVIKHRVIDLDQAYEQIPNQLHLKSYFEMCGIKDYVLSNPHLRYEVSEARNNRLFKRYCVLHIDRRATETRNIRGVNWKLVVASIREQGIEVIQVGNGDHETVGLELNTVNLLLLQWVCAGAEFFLGVDSGVAAIAVALNIKSVIMFGSVNPTYIHPDLSKVIVLQSTCPIGTQHCWHSKPSTSGVLCAVSVDEPPCTILSAERVLQAVGKIMNL